MNNSDLNRLLEKGDEDSFKILFEAMYQPLVSYLIQYTQKVDDAEDIAQNTFIKLWETQTKINLKTSVKSYIYAIAYNLFIDNYRKEKRKDSFLDNFKYEALQSIIEEPEENLDKKLKLIQEIITKLPTRCKVIFIMHKKQGYSYKEIAKELDISIKTVEAQISIALKKIRDVFNSKTDFYLMLLFQRLKK